jgi:hypothetical protein
MASIGASPKSNICYDLEFPFLEYEILEYGDMRELTFENSEICFGIKLRITKMIPIESICP